VKIDRSKLSNKDDLVALGCLLVLFLLMGMIMYLAANEENFEAGFVAATATWKWKQWLYDPMDRFLEKHWPFSG
jgi:hypothetical protein